MLQELKLGVLGLKSWVNGDHLEDDVSETGRARFGPVLRPDVVMGSRNDGSAELSGHHTSLAAHARRALKHFQCRFQAASACGSFAFLQSLEISDRP